MSTTTPDINRIEVSTKVDPVVIVAEEIDSARRENRPTSRQALAKLLAAKSGIEARRASDLVDEYCDEHDAGVPMYLESEFLPGYLKVVAVLLVLVSFAVFGFGVNLLNQQKTAWPALVLATLVLGIGALAWAKSLNKTS